ncbi:hypothetical protein LJC19_08075, partial [Oxalobacter sp. OttesenSCG-928-P03]|nr:hypothetical protein [Oxalobacter sp. OttesenSCG-928-P03]
TKEKVMARVAGLMAAGRFDTPIINEKGKVTGKHLVGGKDRNKDAIEALKATLAAGGKDGQNLNTLVETMTQRMLQDNSRKMLHSAVTKMTESEAAMQSAMVEWTESGYLKQSSGIQSLIKLFAQQKIRMGEVGDEETKAIERARQLALGYKHAEDAIKELLKAQDDADKARIASIVDPKKQAQAEYDFELKNVREQYEARKKGIQEALSVETITGEQRKNLMDAQRANEEAFTARSMELATKRAEAMKSELERQTEDWMNFNKEIDEAAKGWADGFLGEFNKFLTTGKADWRQFLVDMLTEMSRINLQKSFGDLIAGGFGGVGDYLKDIFAMGRNGGKKGDVTSTMTNTAAAAATTHSEALAKVFGDLTISGDQVTKSLNDMGSAQDVVSGLLDGTGGMLNTAGLSTVQMGLSADAATTALQTFAAAATAAASQMNASAAASSSSSSSGGMFSWLGSLFPFADGGIMTSKGAIPLRKYAKGGIANSPQLALFGEGGMNEAFVPLPDGRSIPVTFKGDMGSAAHSSPVTIAITINEAQGGEEQSSSSGGSNEEMKMWKSMANKIKDVVREEIVKNKAPGGMLYNR